MAYSLEKAQAQAQNNQPAKTEDLDFSNIEMNQNSEMVSKEKESKAQGIDSESSGFDFLEPKKDIYKEAKSDPYRIMVTEKDAYQMTLKTLNAISVVSPVVTGLLETFDGQDTKKLNTDFNKIITEISVVAESTCSKIGVDPSKGNNRWVRNVLERVYANMAYDQWIKKQDVKLEDVYYLIEKIVEFAEKSAEKLQYQDLDADSSVKLACITAMSPIIAEMEEATLFRNVEKDIEPIMDKLMIACENGLNKLASDYANPENRGKMYALLMQEAGKLYAASWKNEVKRIQTYVAKHGSNERLQKQIEDYKKNGGMPLTNIDNNFDKFFERIVVVTKLLVENRRKKTR